MRKKKKILVIQKVHDKGMELIKNHPNFTIDVTDDVSEENLKKKKLSTVMVLLSELRNYQAK